ncbi:MAG: hypothetical protein U1A78_18385 [Polyangia bacterium]
MAFDLDEFLRGARLGRYRLPGPDSQPEPVPRPLAPEITRPPLPSEPAAAVSELGPPDAPRLLVELEQAAAALCGAAFAAVAPGLARAAFLVGVAFGPGPDAAAQAEARAELPGALDDVEDLLEACALLSR